MDPANNTPITHRDGSALFSQAAANAPIELLRNRTQLAEQLAELTRQMHYATGGFEELRHRVQDLSKNLLLLYFQLRNSLTDLPDWVTLLKNEIIPLIKKQREGILSEEEVRIMQEWLKHLPMSKIVPIFDLLLSFPDFAAYWTVLPLNETTLIPGSPLMEFFKGVLYNYPELHFKGIKAPDSQTVCQSPFYDQYVFALQFPQQFAKPPLDLQHLFAEFFPEVWEEKDDPYALHPYLNGMLIFYTERGNPHLLVQLRGAVETFIKKICSISKDDLCNEAIEVYFFQAFAVLCEVFKGIPSPTTGQLEAFGLFVHSVLKNHKKCGSRQGVNQLVAWLVQCATIDRQWIEVLDEDLSFCLNEGHRDAGTPEEKNRFFENCLILQWINPRLIVRSQDICFLRAPKTINEKMVYPLLRRRGHTNANFPHGKIFKIKSFASKILDRQIKGRGLT